MFVQLCASHVASWRRFHALCRQLNSIRAQTVKAPLLLSISTSPELGKDVRDALTKHTVDMIINIYWRDKQLSQFEHYALLATELSDENNTWCLFFDDDDFCHPKRVEWYMDAINNCESDTVFCCNGVMGIFSDSAIEMDLFQLTKNENTKPNSIGRGGDEYWMFATRLKYLKTFCDCVGNQILSSIACDLVWRNFLRITNCKFANASTWLYAKTMDNTFDHVSLNNDAIVKVALINWNNVKNKLALSIGIDYAFAMWRMRAHHSSYSNLISCFGSHT